MMFLIMYTEFLQKYRGIERVNQQKFEYKKINK